MSAISISRRAPIRTEAMAAHTSPSRTSGIREFTLMTSITDRIGSPREMILMAGSRRPSWKISVASPVSEPGAMPPTSELWAMLAVQAMMRPSAKTGIATTTSFRWVTPP